MQLYNRTTGPVLTKFCTKHPWVKGTQGFTNGDYSILEKEIIFFPSNQCYEIIKAFLECVNWRKYCRYIIKRTIYIQSINIDLNWFLRLAMCP